MDDKKDFKVNLGDPIQLQYVPDEGRERLAAKIIGHSPGKSLIISAPNLNGKFPLLKENQPFIARMLQGNNVYGFESAVLKYYSVPFPHVHLRHPKDVERIVVRGSRRVETELVVSITTKTNQDKPISVSMLNTSATGALLQSRHNIGGMNDELIISVELEVVNIKKYLRIKAIIRNISTPEDSETADDDLNKYGVQFVELSEDNNLIVNAYVYEQIVKKMHDH